MYFRRCYSRPPKSALKLWVKLNESPSMKVSTESCIDVDDFANNIRAELNTKCRVSLFASLDKEAIKPWLTINELFKTEFKNNSGISPLFVKIVTKTISIGTTNDFGDLTGSYITVKVKDNHAFDRILKDCKGLVPVSDLDTVIVDFDDIKDGETYKPFKHSF